MTASPLPAGLRRVQVTPAPTAATAAPTETALGLATEKPTHSYDPPTPGPTVSPERRAAIELLTTCGTRMTSFYETAVTCGKALRASEAAKDASVTSATPLSEFPDDLHTEYCQCWGELEEAAEETNDCIESLFKGDAAGPVPEDALKATLELLATWKHNVCGIMQCSGRVAMCSSSADPSAGNSSAAGRRMDEGEQQGEEDLWTYDVVVPVDQEAFNQYYVEIVGDAGKHDRSAGVYRVRHMGSPSLKPTPHPTSMPTVSPSAGIEWVNQCMNGFFDEGETAIDCGGGECPKCHAGRGCKIAPVGPAATLQALWNGASRVGLSGPTPGRPRHTRNLNSEGGGNHLATS